MITANEIVSAFQGYLAAGDGYIPGASGQVWTQSAQDQSTNEMVKKYGQQWVGHRVEDCSGAFVRAYKAQGMSIYHGSNRIAREHVEALLPVAEARPGMAVFKARAPGEKYYALPAEYRQGKGRCNGDLNDYYHIGLVDEDGAHVLHCANVQSGFVRGDLTQGWVAAARLREVSYDAAPHDLRALLLTARRAIEDALTRLEEEKWNT